MMLEVIHENKDLIVVNKQSGLISEKSPFEKITVEDQIKNHLTKVRKNPFIGIIHRLDRVTSGVLIFAKKKSILVNFNKLFSTKKVQKTYLAIVEKEPEIRKDELVNFLFKNNLKKKSEIKKVKSKETQEAILTYEVIDKNEFGYLLKIKPKTGRFHQIRAQLSHMGCPIIGDEKYGAITKHLPLSIGLHSWKINYKDPKSMEFISFEAPLPKNKYWNFNSIK